MYRIPAYAFWLLLCVNGLCFHVPAFGQKKTPPKSLLEDCGSYDEYIRKGRQALNNPDDSHLKDAIQAFRAARECQPSRFREVDKWLDRVFERMEKSRREAVEARVKAELLADNLKRAKAETDALLTSSESVSLALRARDSLRYDPTRALTRAVESIKYDTTSLNMNVLMEAFGLLHYDADTNLGRVVKVLAASPDRNRLAIAWAGKRYISLYDSLYGPERQLRGHRDEVSHLAFSPDGSYLLSAGRDLSIKLWTAAGRFIRTIGQAGAEVRGLAFSSKKEIIVASDNGQIEYYALDGTWLRTKSDTLLLGIAAFAASPTSTDQVVAAGTDGKLFIFGENGRPLVQQLVREADILAIKFSPDGNQLAVTDSRERLYLVDSSGTVQNTLALRRPYPVLHFLDVDNLILAGRNGQALLLNLPTSRPLALVGHKADINVLHHHQNHIFTYGADSTWKQWDFRFKRTPYVFYVSQGASEEVVHLHESGVIDNDSRIELRSRKYQRMVKLTIQTGEGFQSADFVKEDFRNLNQTMQDGRLLTATCEFNGMRATMRPDGTLILWDRNGDVVNTMETGIAGATGILFSTEGTYLMVRAEPDEQSGGRYQNAARLLVYWLPDAILQHPAKPVMVGRVNPRPN
ncbi:WD40 repeat domain-containing protein [Tellurirhabdus rosea]|uniref:WD40 repeat domain-containing protein n=1 Tax=Tellurirhabdus rosea TaxID=2674997 RepID=UPI002255294D|nr:hypothetical protein [Tellurirhabdus rosea]